MSTPKHPDLRMIKLHSNISNPKRWDRMWPSMKMLYIMFDVQGLIAHAAVTDNEKALTHCRG